MTCRKAEVSSTTTGLTLVENDAASDSSTSASDHSPPTIRRRDDVAGCGCVRCQSVHFDVVRRSIAGAAAWCLGVLRRHPSVLLVFLLLGGVQSVLERGGVTGPLADATLPIVGQLGDATLPLAAVVGFLGVFLGRGYAGLVTAGDLRGSDRSRTATVGRRARVAVRRFPSFLAAAVLAIAGLFGLIVAATAVVSPALNALLPAVGFADLVTTVDAVLLVGVTVAVVVVLVKLCFLPEACFVGGYGPVSALRVTWSLTAVHRRKAIALTAGLLALFVLGTLLDARIGTTTRPVVLSVTVYDTTVPVRSIGIATSSPVRLLVDATLSAVYYPLFAHQYVHALFDGR